MYIPMEEFVTRRQGEEMKLVEKSVVDFIDEVDSASPAPGGGSVSALVGSLGASLSRMVGHLTVNKKKFKGYSEEIQWDFMQRFEELYNIKSELNVLVDRDTEAFNHVMAAFKLPKESEEEKVARSAAIEEATYKAIDVPMVIGELSYRGLELIEYFVEYGNKNAITDLGVSALLLASALEGAILNVKINLPGISDQEYVETTKVKCVELLEGGLEIKRRVLVGVEANL